MGIGGCCLTHLFPLSLAMNFKEGECSKIKVIK